MRDLKRHEQPIPGIALSGYGMKDDIRESMEAGFARHLTKPVDWQELKVAIQKIASEQACRTRAQTWSGAMGACALFHSRARSKAVGSSNRKGG